MINKSYLRFLMGLSEHEPNPNGVFKFTCHRFLNEYPGIPIQVVLKDNFKELEISVEEYYDESILFDTKIELDTSIDYAFTQMKPIPWYGSVSHTFHTLSS